MSHHTPRPLPATTNALLHDVRDVVITPGPSLSERAEALSGNMKLTAKQREEMQACAEILHHYEHTSRVREAFIANDTTRNCMSHVIQYEGNLLPKITIPKTWPQQPAPSASTPAPQPGSGGGNFIVNNVPPGTSITSSGNTCNGQSCTPRR